MPSHGDDPPFTVLLSNEKIPPSVPIHRFLPDPQNHFRNQAITKRTIDFGILNPHNLDHFVGRDFADLDVSGFAFKQDLYLVPILFTNFGSIETFFDEETIHERVGIFGTYGLPYIGLEFRNLLALTRLEHRGVRTSIRGR